MPKPAVTRVSNLEISPSSTNKEKGFYTAPITTAQRDAMTQANGSFIYNTTTGTFQGRQAGTWNNINTSVSTATGVGLVTGSALTLPTGTRAAVEVAANQVLGFIYYDTTNDAIRTWAGNPAAWKTVAVA